MRHPHRGSAPALAMAAFATASLIAPLPDVGQAKAAETGGHGTLDIGISQFPENFHPNIESMAAKFFVLDMAHRHITYYDEDWERQCQLCTELPTFDNGRAVLEETPDGEEGVAVTYDLDPDAQWGDGTPITTDDIVFTWEAGRHDASSFRDSELYRTIYDITVHDEHSFTVHRDRVTYTYNLLNDMRPLPAHLEQELFEDDPREYRHRTLYDADTTNPGLYFGPYRVAEVETGSHILLEANETWHGDPPYFDRIVVRTVEDTSALEANLLSGEIDMIEGSLGLSVTQALQFEDRHGDGYVVDFVPGLVYEHIDINLDNPLLDDHRVRHALLYALDRQSLVDELFAGEQPVAHSNVSPLDRGHYEDVPRYEHDPELAADLLDEAGFTEMQDGVRATPDGETLTLTLQTTAGDRTREMVQQVLQSQWSDVGIEIRIDNEPARVFFGTTMQERRFEALGLYAWIAAPENVPRPQLHSTEIPTEDNNWSGQNYPGYRSEDMDAAIEAAESEIDDDARLDHWATIQRLYAEDLPVLPLFFRAYPYILPDWLEGLTPTGHLHAPSNHVEQWRRSDL